MTKSKKSTNNTRMKENITKKESKRTSQQRATKSKQKVKSTAKKEKEDIKKEEKRVQSPEEELVDVKDKYIRLSAEFDNYRKRTLKERLDFFKTAGEEILVNILPIMDDFERALKAIKETEDIKISAVEEGVDLIYIKFKDFLKQQGVKEIESLNQEFNTDLHEAVTKIKAPKDNLKGKIVDVIEKGYLLNEKVIRFSKVVIGE